MTRFIVTSLVITLVIHGFLVTSIAVFADRSEILPCNGYEVPRIELQFRAMKKCRPDEDDRFAGAVTIEAALAFKNVDPKNKQPVKVKKKKYKPTERGVSRDPDAKPRDKTKDPKHKVAVEDDEIDFDAVREKNRSQDPDLSSAGVDEKPKEGSASGSEWGTEKEAKGHPYAGELRGRIHSVWEVPALEKEGGTALGCVRLNPEGKIIDSKLKKRSKNSNLNRSVTLALKKGTKDGKSRLPKDMLELLTVKGICFRFELEEQ